MPHVPIDARTAASLGAMAIALAVTFVWRRLRVPPSRRLLAVSIAAMVALIAATRMLTFGEAIERDEAAYMVIADGLLHGRALYADLWDHKPPAIHMTYAAAAALFGPTPWAFWVMGWITSLVTLWGCYRAGAALGGQVSGLVAAGLWTIIEGDLRLQANQPNVEVFMNACLVWAFVAVVETPMAGNHVSRWMTIGAAYFLATLYKPVAVTVAVAVAGVGGVWIATASPERDTRQMVARIVRSVGLAGAVAAAGWALVFAYFWATDRLATFREAFLEYNRDYAGSLSENLSANLVPPIDALLPFLPYAPLMLGAGIIALAGLLGEQRRGPGLLLAYLVGAWLSVVMPGHSFPHYFQLMLPPAAIGGAWLIARLLERRSIAGVTCAALACWLGLSVRLYQSTIPLADLPVFKYGGYGFDVAETQRMGAWLRGRLSPDAVLFHWGADPSVYLYARRPSPVRFVYNLPLKDSTDRARRFTAGLIAQLEATPPDMIVAFRRELATVDHPVDEWVTTRYEPITGPAGIDRYVFLVPRQTMKTASGKQVEPIP